MRITLIKRESLDFFYNALCNGLSLMSGYGLQLVYDANEYNISRAKLTSPCFEDVLIQMLKDGYKLTLIDVEGDNEHTSSITITDVYKRVMKTEPRHLLDMVNETDDAITADNIIQQTFFNKQIFA